MWFQSGVAIMQGYGLTETSPTICMQESGSQNFASVGSLVANTEAKIVDMDDHDKVLRSNEVFKAEEIDLCIHMPIKKLE